MHKALSRLLNQPHDQLGSVINELEARNGFPSEDVRLIAENKQTMTRVISDLGLDPSDTTSEELYHALLAKFSADAKMFDQAVVPRDNQSLDQKIDLAVEICRHLFSNNQVWALKPAVAKRVLLAWPPKKVTKLLSYRSVNSMVKREAISRLYLLAGVVETANWKASLDRRISALPTSSWLVQPIHFERLPLISNSHSEFYVSSKACGAIAMLTPEKLNHASVLNLVLLYVEAVENLGIHIDSHKVANLHPSLNWWTKTKHLVSDHGGSNISTNLKDIAKSHLMSAGFEDRILHHAQLSLWAELMSRYRKYSFATDSITSEDSTGMVSFDQSNNANLPKHLAIEYSEI